MADPGFSHFPRGALTLKLPAPLPVMSAGMSSSSRCPIRASHGSRRVPASAIS